MSSARLSLTVDPSKVQRRLMVASACVLALGFAAHLVIRGDPPEFVREIARPLLLDAEIAIPAWYSSILLLLVGIVGLAIGAAQRPSDPVLAGRWALIGLVFFYLSLDEAIILHETLDEGLARLLNIKAGLPLWTIPAAVAVALVGWRVLPLFRGEAPDLRRSWVLAVLLYAGGAIGVEIVARGDFATSSEASLRYIELVLVEEAMEIFGVVIFLVALLRHVERDAWSSLVDITDDNTGDSGPPPVPSLT